MSKEKETVVSEVVVADNTVVTAEDVVKKAIDDATKVAEDAPAAELLPLSAYWGKEFEIWTNNDNEHEIVCIN